jgi:CBS domain containing-hemolysin-like protein
MGTVVLIVIALLLWAATSLVLGLFLGAVSLRREQAREQAEDAARRARFLRGELL